MSSQGPTRGDGRAVWVHDAAVLAALAASALIILARGFIDPDALLGSPSADLAKLIHPLRHYAFKAGDGWPRLWNPHLFFGIPFLAQYHSGLLYPLNWIFIVLPLNTALNMSVALHVFLAGAFMYAYARRLTGGSIWALPSALSFMMFSPW